jgi:hypothetical protein
MNISVERYSYSLEQSLMAAQFSSQKNNNIISAKSSSAFSCDCTQMEINAASFVLERFHSSVSESISSVFSDPALAEKYERMFEDASNIDSESDPDLESRIDDIDEMLGEWSSEQTAKRITSFVTGFYEHYTEKFNSGVKTIENLDGFMNFVTSAIDTGFSEANAEIGAVSEEVSGIIQRTHDKVHKNLDDFYSSAIEDITTPQNNEQELISVLSQAEVLSF